MKPLWYSSQYLKKNYSLASLLLFTCTGVPTLVGYWELEKLLKKSWNATHVPVQSTRDTKHLTGEKISTKQRNSQQSKQTKQLTKEQNENKAACWIHCHVTFLPSSYFPSHSTSPLKFCSMLQPDHWKLT